jgi:hypothetical protein
MKHTFATCAFSGMSPCFLGMDARRRIVFTSVELAATRREHAMRQLWRGRGEGSNYWCELPPETDGTWQAIGLNGATAVAGCPMLWCRWATRWRHSREGGQRNGVAAVPGC